MQARAQIKLRIMRLFECLGKLNSLSSTGYLHHTSAAQNQPTTSFLPSVDYMPLSPTFTGLNVFAVLSCLNRSLPLGCYAGYVPKPT